MLPITTISASVLGLLLVKLSLDVILLRRKHNVSIGDGGRDDLLRAARAQANLAEYAPIALILIACLEFNAEHQAITVTLSSLFVVGRFLHPMGIKSAEAPWLPRTLGIALTLISLIALGISNLVLVWIM